MKNGVDMPASTLQFRGLSESGASVRLSGIIIPIIIISISMGGRM